MATNIDIWEFRPMNRLDEHGERDLKPPFYPERHLGSTMQGLDGHYYKATMIGKWVRLLKSDPSPLTDGRAGLYCYDASGKLKDAYEHLGEVVLDSKGYRVEAQADIIWKRTKRPPGAPPFSPEPSSEEDAGLAPPRPASRPRGRPRKVPLGGPRPSPGKSGSSSRSSSRSSPRSPGQASRPRGRPRGRPPKH